MLKLRKRIESRLEGGLKLWVVVPNPQLMIYFGDILALRNIGVDLIPENIVPIIELLKIL